MDVVEARVGTSEILWGVGVDTACQHHCSAVAAGLDHPTAHGAATGRVIRGATTPPPRNGEDELRFQYHKYFLAAKMQFNKSQCP